MWFKVGDSTINLLGDPSLCKTQITLKALMQAMKRREQGVLIEFINSELSSGQETASILDVLQSVLRLFSV